MEERPVRYQLKPLQIVLLLFIVVGMFTGHVPLWMGLAILVVYVLMQIAMYQAMNKIFMAPFAMQGAALAGAECDLHSYEWSESPFPEEGEDRDEARRFAWIDVTITPTAEASGFTHWEPDALMLAPADMPLNSPADFDLCYDVEEIRIVEGGVEREDEEHEYVGPLRVKLLVGLPEGERVFKFVYYLQEFGHFELGE